MGYCDDYLFPVQPEHMPAVRALVKADFHRFGFILGWKKCGRDGITKCISLGIKVDVAAMTYVVPEDKKISKNVGCAGCHNPHISYKKKYGK